MVFISICGCDGGVYPSGRSLGNIWLLHMSHLLHTEAWLGGAKQNGFEIAGRFVDNLFSFFNSWDPKYTRVFCPT